jgi:orotate phosphoribosyltransferase
MDARALLENYGCIYEGHFVGVSGKHLAGYCNIDPLMPHAAIVGQMVEELVKPFKDIGVETVVAPAVGAIPMAHWGAYHLEKMTGKEIYGVWADKVKPKGFDFERSGFLEVVNGKKVLILEDIINQMHSIKLVVDVVRKAGGDVVGVGSVTINRGVSAEAIGVPKLVNLTKVEYDAWTAEDCQKVGLCSKNVPIIVDVGHGDEYQADNPDYKGGYTTLL